MCKKILIFFCDFIIEEGLISSFSHSYSDVIEQCTQIVNPYIITTTGGCVVSHTH